MGSSFTIYTSLSRVLIKCSSSNISEKMLFRHENGLLNNPQLLRSTKITAELCKITTFWEPVVPEQIRKKIFLSAGLQPEVLISIPPKDAPERNPSILSFWNNLFLAAYKDNSLVLLIIIIVIIIIISSSYEGRMFESLRN